MWRGGSSEADAKGSVKQTPRSSSCRQLSDGNIPTHRLQNAQLAGADSERSEGKICLTAEAVDFEAAGLSLE